MPDTKAPAKLPAPVNPGEALRAEDWNLVLAAVAGLLAVGGASSAGALDVSARARLLAEGIMLATVTEVIQGGTVIDGASLPSLTTYVFVADHAPGIRLGAPGAGAIPEYGRPTRGDEARIWPQPVGSKALLLRWPDPSTPGGWTTRACVLNEKVARRMCGS